MSVILGKMMKVGVEGLNVYEYLWKICNLCIKELNKSSLVVGGIDISV